MAVWLKKEWLPLVLLSLPFLYLGVIWNELPDRVPLHWNIKGEIDRYGSKSELWLLPVFTSLLIYVILTVVPVIDPKKRVAEMGAKFAQLKIVMVAIMSSLAIVIIHTTANQEMASPGLFVVIIGVLISLLGGFMKYIKPNYFIGIRTPWTLESTEVWDKTHQFGGRLFLLAGIVIVGAGLLIETEKAFHITVISIVTVALISMVYSFILYKKLPQ
jgi:uncharacterized membrane protein